MEVNAIKNYKPLIALCFGYFMVIFDVTVVNVATTSIAKDLHINLTNISWIINAYTLCFAALLLSVGSISDRYGAKLIFQSGLVLFILTSFLCGIAPNFYFLIIARLLQGVGAALLVPTSISLVNSSYINKAELTKAIAIWAAVSGVGAACGPVLGAVIIALSNWRGIFFVNIPLGIICFYLTHYWVDKPEIRSSKLKFDFVGQIFGIISIASLTFALIEVKSTSLLCFSGMLFLLSFSVFIINESFYNSPMLPLKLFKSFDFSSSITIGLLLNMGFYGELFLLPAYFHLVKHYSLFLSGFAVAPQTLLIALGNYSSGKYMNYLSVNRTMILGLIFGACGFLGLFIVTRYNLNYLFFIIPLLLIGFGTSFTMPAATIATIRAVSASESGIASGVLNTSRQIGSLVGVALFGVIAYASSSFALGTQHAYAFAGCLFLFGTVTLLKKPKIKLL